MCQRSHGILAERYGFGCRPLEVLSSAAGYYIGTSSEEGLPISRESLEYFQTHAFATVALRTGAWTQRDQP